MAAKHRKSAWALDTGADAMLKWLDERAGIGSRLGAYGKCRVMNLWKIFVSLVIGTLGMVATSRAVPPTEKIRPPGKPVKLNNLVTELVRTPFRQGGPATYCFENPRDGWIFVSVPAETAASGKVVVSLDNSSPEQPIVSRTRGRHGEAMRLASSRSSYS